MFVGKNCKHHLIISLEIQEKCDDSFFSSPFFKLVNQMNVVSKIARLVTIYKRKIQRDLVAFAPTWATNSKDKVDNKVSKVGVRTMEWLRSPYTLCWVRALGALVKVS